MNYLNSQTKKEQANQPKGITTMSKKEKSPIQELLADLEKQLARRKEWAKDEEKYLEKLEVRINAIKKTLK